LKQNATLAGQIKRVAASVIIQTYWRGHYTRLKYTYVRFGEASLTTFFRLSTLPNSVLSTAVTRPDTSTSQSQASDRSIASPAPSSPVLVNPNSGSRIGLSDSTKGNLKLATSVEDLENYLRRRLRWIFNSSNLAESIALQEKLLLKHQIYCGLCESQGRNAIFFDEFCALKIQCTWRSMLARRALRKTFESIRVAVENGGKAINYLQRENERTKVETLRKNRDLAACRLQRRWRYHWVRNCSPLYVQYLN
jgi:hypothetical protein